jgi:hypothetical protein
MSFRDIKIKNSDMFRIKTMSITDSRLFIASNRIFVEIGMSKI